MNEKKKCKETMVIHNQTAVPIFAWRTVFSLSSFSKLLAGTLSESDIALALSNEECPRSGSSCFKEIKL